MNIEVFSFVLSALFIFTGVSSLSESVSLGVDTYERKTTTRPIKRACPKLIATLMMLFRAKARQGGV